MLWLRSSHARTTERLRRALETRDPWCGPYESSRGSYGYIVVHIATFILSQTTMANQAQPNFSENPEEDLVVLARRSSTEISIWTSSQTHRPTSSCGILYISYYTLRTPENYL